MLKFYLGTHIACWIGPTPRKPEETLPRGIPLFVSRNQLAGRRSLPNCYARTWALDSGGFTELQNHGRWRIGPKQYAREVRRYVEEIGRLDYAAPQDWMCEEVVIRGGKLGRLHFVGTHLSVEEHQRRTVHNFIELRCAAPELPFIPILQGFTPEEYLRCADMYDAVGVDLSSESVVGVGSVCRRQARKEIASLFRMLWQAGIPRLHGFGVKRDGIDLLAAALAEAEIEYPTLNPTLNLDSLVWSDEARRRPPLPGCTGHKNCANCARYAVGWYEQTVGRMSTALQHGRTMGPRNVWRRREADAQQSLFAA